MKDTPTDKLNFGQSYALTSKSSCEFNSINLDYNKNKINDKYSYLFGKIFSSKSPCLSKQALLQGNPLNLFRGGGFTYFCLLTVGKDNNIGVW
jgi:hypothetical protein